MMVYIQAWTGISYLNIMVIRDKVEKQRDAELAISNMNKIFRGQVN